MQRSRLLVGLTFSALASLSLASSDFTWQAMDMTDDLGVSFPVLFGSCKEVSKLYDVEAMPVTVLVDREARIRRVHHGYQPGYEDKYVDQIRALLRE